MTFIGLEVWGVGEEANPFYAPFTEAGVEWMFIGVFIYGALVYIWFLKIPGWTRAVSAGALVMIHFWGAISWIRMTLDSAQFFFDPFWIIVLPPTVGSMITFLILVNFRTCPGVPSGSELVIYR